MLPRRRRQPSGGTARVEAVFSDQGGGGHRGGYRRYAMVVGALVPPDAARVATSGATVCTSAPKQSREAVFANLCTLLRPLTCPQRRNSVHKCPKTDPRGQFRRFVYTLASPPGGDAYHAARAVTQPPTHTNSRSPISFPTFGCYIMTKDLSCQSRGAPDPVSDSVKGRSLVAVSPVWRSAYLV